MIELEKEIPEIFLDIMNDDPMLSALYEEQSRQRKESVCSSNKSQDIESKIDHTHILPGNGQLKNYNTFE